MDLGQMVQGGGASPVFLAGAALVLGALHGLEPGHSKTMMAAFIIAVRGTVRQAILLGTSAAFSHTLIVWVLALLALTYGNEMIAEDLEPWFMVVSGMIILAIALWVLVQTRRQSHLSTATGAWHGHEHAHHHHDHHHHHHGQGDAHARAHARAIEHQFAGGQASSGQIVWFGLTGGLIPCPAAVTVLLVCLHLQQFWLGVGLVGSFSVGLALTLVAVGVAAAWGTALARRRSGKLDALFARAPYLSALLIGTIGLVMLYSGGSLLIGTHA